MEFEPGTHTPGASVTDAPVERAWQPKQSKDTIRTTEVVTSQKGFGTVDGRNPAPPKETLE